MAGEKVPRPRRKQSEAQRIKRREYNKLYMRKWTSKRGSLDEPKVALSTDKYAHLLDEPVNPGKTYAEYSREGALKRAPKRKVLMDRLRVERKERIKRCGPIKMSKTGWFLFPGSSGKPARRNF